MGTELFRAEDGCGDGCGSSTGSSAREREDVLSPFTSCMIRLPSSNIILGGLMVGDGDGVGFQGRDIELLRGWI